LNERGEAVASDCHALAGSSFSVAIADLQPVEQIGLFLGELLIREDA
jgi:hypothetical protein